jgi:hypothetical protein
MSEESRKQICRKLDIPLKTVSSILQKLRKTLVEKYLNCKKC